MSYEDIVDNVVNIVNDITNGNICNDSSFQDISMDSIKFIRIIVEIENVFNIEVDDEMLLVTKFPNIKSIVEYVKSKI